MRSNRNRIILALTLAWMAAMPLPSAAAVFGNAVAIGGQASDIALDEARGVLYIANFTANRIDVMSLADNTIRTSWNIDYGQPGALAISPDGHFLVVAGYEPLNDPAAKTGYLTVINLDDRTRMGTGIDKPLALAFTNQGKALIVTTTGFDLLEPGTMSLEFVSSFSNLNKDLAVPFNTFPAEILSTQLTASKDGSQIYGLATAASGQILYRYDTARRLVVMAQPVVAVPALLPRVSVSDDGSYAMVGYAMFDRAGHMLAQAPDAVLTKNIGGHALDSSTNTLYAHLTDAFSKNLAASSAPSGPTGPVVTAGVPLFSILDADNLTVRDRLYLSENITGRGVLNRARDTMYAVSDSGVLVLPVGSINQYHRLKTNQEDVVVRATFCDRRVATVNLVITDPGGGSTDFAITSNTPGVTIAPQTGQTPATVTIRVDPNAFANTNGVVAVPVAITSKTAVNLPPAIRLLVNNRIPDQRGTPVNVPGTLTDLLADPVRNRFYIVRQDKNVVLVFDGSTYQQIAALRTGTTPTRLAITQDRKFLLVGHDNSQLASVYDLDALDQPQQAVYFPYGEYPRALAASGTKLLAVARLVPDASLTNGSSPAIGPGSIGVAAAISAVDMNARTASMLPTLGVFKNGVNPATVLAAAPNGNLVIGAQPDGTVFLYNATVDSFTASRQDLPALQGAFAASSYEQFLVGTTIFNASLVPVSQLETTSGASSGFVFVDQTGVRVTSAGAPTPGVIQRYDPASTSSKQSRMAEAPLTPVPGLNFTRTLAALASRAALVSLTTSGFTVLAWNYDAAVAPPRIDSVVNSADSTQPVAPGGLITITGVQMSAVNMASREVPLPTALGESCLTVNGVPVPMIMVSSNQINGQMPSTVDGVSTMVLRTPGGTSDNFNLTIYPAAPRVFRSGTAGPQTGLATIVRSVNNELVTLSNPIHSKDSIVIYATGLGRTVPAIDDGLPAPMDPLTTTVIIPNVSLGGTPLTIDYAGLVPGEVGVYQINATVPGTVPLGMEIPLTIDQGGVSTTLTVRVVK